MRCTYSATSGTHFAMPNDKGRPVPICQHLSKRRWLKATGDVDCDTCKRIATHLTADLLMFLDEAQARRQRDGV